MAQRVIVVGGGLVGLAAASRLRAAGVAVSVLEASAAMGGRARGDRIDGTCLDAAPNLLGARDRALPALLAEAGLTGEMLPLRPCALAQVHAGAVREVDRGGGLARAFPPGVSWRSRLRLRRLDRLMRRFDPLFDPARPEHATRLDDRSAADFTRTYFGPSALAAWAGPQVEAELHGDPERFSRAAFMHHLAARDGAWIGTLRAGIGRLVEALAHEDDRTGYRVDRIALEGGALSVRPKGDGRQATLGADAVILTTAPSDALACADALLTTPERRFLVRARGVPTLVLVLLVDGAPLRQATYLRVPAAERSPLAAVLVEPGADGARVPEGRSAVWALARPSFAASNELAPESTVRKELEGALQRLLPGAARDVRHAVLHREFRGAPDLPPGSLRAIAAFQRVQADRRAQGRRLYFAGDHLVGPGVEAAVASGRRAAGDVLADLEPAG